VVVRDLAKVEARVRFPYPAPFLHVFSKGERVVKGASGVVVFGSLTKLAYLCGSAEFAEQRGKLCRHKIGPFLRDKLGHQVYDPAEDGRKNLTHRNSTISITGK
jgi:hypothetical protein